MTLRTGGANLFKQALVLVALAIVAAATVHLSGKAAVGYTDVDQSLYQQTLTRMHHGEGYYDAMRDGLTEKENRPPSNVRGFRLPTLFVLLHDVPSSLWRAASGVVIWASLLGALMITSGFPLVRRAVAVVLVWHWFFMAEAYLDLHPEFWGVPFALFGVVALQRKRWWLAVAFLAGATCFRELYLALFVGAAVIFPELRRRAIPVAAVLAALGAAHFAAASSRTMSTGYQPPLDGMHTVRAAIDAITFGFTPVWTVVASIAMVAVFATLATRVRFDRVALLVAGYSILMLVLTVFFGHIYWGLVFGPLLIAFVAFIEPPRIGMRRRA